MFGTIHLRENMYFLTRIFVDIRFKLEKESTNARECNDRKRGKKGTRSCKQRRKRTYIHTTSFLSDGIIIGHGKKKRKERMNEENTMRVTDDATVRLCARYNDQKENSWTPCITNLFFFVKRIDTFAIKRHHRCFLLLVLSAYY